MTKKIISDASTLILLEKVGLLDNLAKNINFIIPWEVYKEAVVEGKLRQYADAHKIDRKISKNLIKISEIKDYKKSNEIIKEFGIGKGETEAIILFFEEKADLLAVDDHKPINVCKVYNIPFMTALNLVLKSYRTKIIDFKEAEEMIKNLGIYGRYKDELIYRALKLLEAKKW